VVSLNSHPDELFRRLRRDVNRPLLQVADPLSTACADPAFGTRPAGPRHGAFRRRDRPALPGGHAGQYDRDAAGIGGRRARPLTPSDPAMTAPITQTVRIELTPTAATPSPLAAACWINRQATPICPARARR